MSVALNILIVEDTPMAQALCKMVIDRIPNATSDIAEDGRVALEKYKSISYNLILMDVGLPYLNGIEATTEIRKYEQENNIPPVIIEVRPEFLHLWTKCQKLTNMVLDLVVDETHLHAK